MIDRAGKRKIVRRMADRNVIAREEKVIDLSRVIRLHINSVFPPLLFLSRTEKKVWSLGDSNP